MRQGPIVEISTQNVEITKLLMQVYKLLEAEAISVLFYRAYRL